MSDLVDEILRTGEGMYVSVRELPDGTIVGIGRLLFTTAIYMDMNRHGWGRRFCFEDRDLAWEEYHKLQTGDDVPQGWIARRGG
jgi:hypothetical protein